MTIAKDSLLAAYNHLDDEGKAGIAAYIDILGARASLQSAMDAMNAREAESLAGLLRSLSNAPRTKESESLLRAVSERLAEIRAHATEAGTNPISPF